MAKENIDSKIQSAKDIRLMGQYCLSRDMKSPKEAKKLLKTIKKEEVFLSPHGMECVKRITTIAKGGSPEGPCIVCKKNPSVDEGFFCESCKKAVFSAAIKATAAAELKEIQKAEKSKKEADSKGSGLKKSADRASGSKEAASKTPGSTDKKRLKPAVALGAIAAAVIIAVVIFVAYTNISVISIKDNNLENVLSFNEREASKAAKMLEADGIGFHISGDGTIDEVYIDEGSVEGESPKGYNIMGIAPGANVYDTAIALGNAGAMEDVATEEELAREYEKNGTPNLYKIIFVRLDEEAGAVYRYEALVDVETVVDIKVELLKKE